MEFRILGPLEVVDGERPIAQRQGKECALLAYLVLHANEVVPSERLIDELWGERPPPTAAKIIQNAVSHLRKALGDGRLLTRGHAYELRVAPEEVDLSQFQRLAEEGRASGNAATLREALALWRGPALVDVRDETFAQHVSLHLEEERLGVLEDRIAADLTDGCGAELVSELERLVREHPLRERLHGELMLALYRAGRQADALEAYQRARRALMEELGLEPSPRLQKLERQILNQDSELEAPPRPPQQIEPVSSPARRQRRAALALAAVALVAGGVVGIVYALHDGGGAIVATPNSLAVVDPGRNRLVAVVPVGTTPRGVAVGGSVWVANSGGGTVTQVDLRTLEVVQTVGIGAEATDIATGVGDVWVATGSDNTLVQMHSRTGAVLATLSLPEEKDEPTSAQAVAVGEGAVWVASGVRLLKIDPGSGTIVARLSQTAAFHGVLDISTGFGAVWIADQSEVVVRISAVTAAPTGKPVPTVYPSSLAVGYGSVWVAGADYGGTHPAIWEIDPHTLHVTQTISLGKSRLPGPDFGLATGEGAVWLTDYDRGTLLRIDPATGIIVSTIRIGGHPRGVAVGAGRIWVSVD